MLQQTAIISKIFPFYFLNNRLSIFHFLRGPKVEKQKKIFFLLIISWINKLQFATKQKKGIKFSVKEEKCLNLKLCLLSYSPSTVLFLYLFMFLVLYIFLKCKDLQKKKNKEFFIRFFFFCCCLHESSFSSFFFVKYIQK